jgi:glycosyltransferase involved in cell wall biosynthesis
MTRHETPIPSEIEVTKVSASCKVTVGMPVWNGERFVRQAIESILGQTFHDLELLISDNASEDRTEQICRQYAAMDTRVKYFRQSKNIGAGANFRWLVLQSSAPFFMWAASDDYFDPHWLEVLLARMDQSTVLAFGAVEEITEDGALVRRMEFPSLIGSAVTRLTRLLLWNEGAGKACLIYGLFRKEHLHRSLYALTDYAASDQLLTFNVLRGGGLVCAPTAATHHKRGRPLGSGRGREPWGFKYLVRRLICLDELDYLSRYTKFPGSFAFKCGMCGLLALKYCIVLSRTTGTRLKKWFGKIVTAGL